MNDTQVHRRLDGRLANEIRSFASEQGGLFRADGSARMSHGNTAVLVAVYGPGTAKARRMEQSDKAVIDVCFKLEKGLTSACVNISRGKNYAVLLILLFYFHSLKRKRV
jgi:ribonuclease PH